MIHELVQKRRACILVLCACLLAGVFALSEVAEAAIPARFSRTPSLSPDGSQIAFGWRGDLWLVSVDGGVARRLTVHNGYDQIPVWSPDGRWIAFASRRHGHFDVFVIKSDGGTPRRLTYHSSHDYPVDWSKDGKRVLFRSRRFRVHTSRTPLYEVPLSGGMPRLILDVSLAGAVVSPDGTQIVLTRGSDRWWRKRWKGPYHSHLWRFERKTRRFVRLTPAGHTASDPSWISDQEIVYRSEKSGCIELWKMNVFTKKREQLTHFGAAKGGYAPWAAVRFPRASRNGQKVVFSRWDRMYIFDFTQNKLREVVPMASADRRENDVVRKVKRSGITEYKVSPNGREVAFVIRGDIFVLKRGEPLAWARRIASSYWRERDLAWSPDGRKLAFVSDRLNGRNAVYVLEAGKKRGFPVLMSQTLRFKLTRITATNASATESGPRWSPSGQTLALRRGRGTLVLHDVATRREQIALVGWNLGHYVWSPDGRWIAFVRSDKNSNSDIYLMRTTGKFRSFNLSRFPDEDSMPVWSANGRVLAFLSRDVHNRNEIRYAFLRKSDHEKSAAELHRACRVWGKRWKRRVIGKKKARARRLMALKRRLRAQKRKAKAPASRPVPKKSAGKPGKKRKRHKGMKPVRVRISDLARLPFRLRRVPYVPGFRGARQLFVGPTGCSFYVSVRGRGISGLYSIRFDGKKLKRLAKGRVSQISILAGRLHYLAKGGRLMQRRLKARRAKPYRFKAEVLIHKQIAYMQKFEEGWNLLNEWFYDPKFHGVDWQKMHSRYRALVAHATNDVDFDTSVRMMLGELNASHLGIYSISRKPRDRTGDLGLTFDLSHTGKGLKIASVRRRGPAFRRRSRLRTGDVLLRVAGRDVSKRSNLHALLNHKAGRNVTVEIMRGKKQKLFAIRPVSTRRARLQRYLTWVERQRALVKKWSGGLLSYAHVRSMNIPSLARFERALFAHTHGTQALVMDVRNNGGGWTADMLLTMFFPKPHAYTQWRGSKKGYPAVRRPYYTWHKPSILLCNEKSVSNAEIFSHAYKNLKLGTLVGMPTYGGVISTRTIRILDGTWFRIPIRGWWALPTKVNMENGPAVPNVVVPLSPTNEMRGTDPQLLKAVRLLLKQLAKKKK